MLKFPTHTQLTLPFLEVLTEAGGKAKPADLYEEIGNRVGLDEKTMAARDPKDHFNLFKRHIRFAKETLKQKGFISSPEYNVWELTEKGHDHLQKCKPGIVLCVFTTPKGIGIWGEFLSVAGEIEDNIVNLHLTSPPYPLNNPREYGNVSTKDYVQWFLPFAKEAYRTLTPDGSFLLDLGEVYNAKKPTVSTYIERLVIALEDLGFHVAGRFYWENPLKLPMTPWVTQHRERIKSVIEPVYWFSKSAFPKADNRKILNPYSAVYLSLCEKEDNKRQVRPAGFDIARTFSKDNGGAIPGNLIRIPATGANDLYLKRCKEHGLKPHPARFPLDLAKWFIRFLTDENDLVADLFGGSGTVGQAAEELDRRWIIGDKSLHYLKTAMLRFADMEHCLEI